MTEKDGSFTKIVEKWEDKQQEGHINMEIEDFKIALKKLLNEASRGTHIGKW